MTRKDLRTPYPFHGMRSAVASDNRAAREALAAFRARQRAARRANIIGYVTASALFSAIAAAVYLAI